MSETKPKTWERFGALLRAKRLDANIGLRAFAKKMDLSPTYISRVECGHIAPPTEKRIKSMARLLDTPSDELLAAAGKVDQEIMAYICRLKSLPAFLREARRSSLKDSHFDKMTKSLHQRRRRNVR